MLPPVRAALSSNSDFQSLAPAAAARVGLAVTTVVAEVDGDKTAPISSGRMDALSLSAQLKLAQSFSIFAETIGKVLNMPRGENEALVDYATRLSEAVRSLNPGERMAIERLLNQIVKGVTLRLLAEILNNPAGPDAARLAAYIETASASERDLAAKAVVSSYRQNASADSSANGGISRAPAGSGHQATAAQSPGAAPVTGSQNAGTIPATSGAPMQATSAAGSPRELQPSAVVSGQVDVETPAHASGNDAKATGQDNRPERPASIASQASPTAAATSSSATRLQAVQVATGATPAGQAVVATPTPTAGATSGVVTSGGAMDVVPALAMGEAATRANREDNREKGPRHTESASRTPSTSSSDGRSGLSNARLMLAELAGWMTGIVSGADVAADGPQTAKPTTQTVPAPGAEDIPQDEGSGPESIVKQTAGPARNGETTSTTPATRPVESLPPENASASPLEVSELDRQMAMLAGGLPQALREGVPLPYVAYPPAEQEPEREERKTRAIAEIGDEEDEAPAQDHGFHGQHQDDEAGEESAEAGAEGPQKESPDEDEGRANDLYWRMAGWA